MTTAGPTMTLPQNFMQAPPGHANKFTMQLLLYCHTPTHIYCYTARAAANLHKGLYYLQTPRQ